MKLVKPSWFDIQKSSIKLGKLKPWSILVCPSNEISSIEINPDSPDTDIEENLQENFEDSCRINLSNKMPANCYLGFKKTTSELVYKRQYVYL